MTTPCGVSTEFGTNPRADNTLKFAAHYRTDVHTEQNFNRPDASDAEHDRSEAGTQSQYTWSLASEDTFHVDAGGGRRRRHQLRRVSGHEGRVVHRGPRALRASAAAAPTRSTGRRAVIWRYSARRGAAGQRLRSLALSGAVRAVQHAVRHRHAESGSRSRARDQSRDRLEGPVARNVRLDGAVFYSDVRDLIQTVLLPDTTTQTQNVGDGEFYGAEISIDADVTRQLTRRRQLHRAQPDDHRRAAAESAADRRADAQGVSLCDVAADREADDHAEPGRRRRSLERREHDSVRPSPTSGPAATRCSISRRSTRCRQQLRRRARVQESGRRQLPAGVGLSAAGAHLLRQDASRSLMTGDARIAGPMTVRYVRARMRRTHAWRCVLTGAGSALALSAQGPPATAGPATRRSGRGRRRARRCR